MKITNILLIGLVAATLLSVQMANSEAIPGLPAPDFKVKDAAGSPRTLAEFRDKWVVLEWFNKDCPFVHKQYDSGNMQALQKKYTDKGVKWLTVISSAKGKQGYLEGAEAREVTKERKSFATAVLLDPSGEMGKAFGAKTTPHMFVLDPRGRVVYSGAIDDNDSSDIKVIPTSHNYVSAALDSAMSGEKVQVSTSRPYGCGVKYQ